METLEYWVRVWILLLTAAMGIGRAQMMPIKQADVIKSDAGINNQSVQLGFLDTSSRLLYKEAFGRYSKVTKQPALAVITSHHLLAWRLISKSLAVIEPADIRRVVVVGPDHYHQLALAPYLAQTSIANWAGVFDNQVLLSDKQLISKFLEPSILVDSTAFRREHSIYVQAPFIKLYFPQAKVVPIMLSFKLDQLGLYREMGRRLSSLVDVDRTLLVISTDFNHDMPVNQSDAKDQRTIALLKQSNISDQEISSIGNDCPQCLAFLYGYLSDIGVSFKLIDNSNSFVISGQSPDKVTSYITGMYVRK